MSADSEMVERVARAYAAYKCRTANPTGKSLPDDIWTQGVPVARVLIAAMREPTDAMLIVGSRMGIESRNDLHISWREMIDAALGGKAS